jgi:PAS domain S-box-containing protein
MNPPATESSPWWRYGVVLLTVAVALLLRWPLWDVLGNDLAFLLFWPAVVFCAWYGGFRAGLFATLLSSLAACYFLLTPHFSFAVARLSGAFGLAVFAVMGCVISALMEALHRARARAVGLARVAETGQEHLRVTLASIGDAVIATDTQGRVTFLNGVAEDLTGWSQTQAVGRPLVEVFHIVNELTRQAADDPVQRVLREGRVVGLANHTVLLARDGTERPIEDSAAPIRDGRGSLTGVVLVFRDVSEQRRAEEQRHKVERRLQTLFENAQDAILLADDQARYVDANPAACVLLGLTREEVLRRTVWDLTPAPNGEMGRQAWQEFLRMGRQGGEYQLLRSDGASVEVEYRAVANIQPGLHLSILRDVGQRKRLEADLQQHMAELADADRRKDEFLAVLAHEMRGPLAPIVTCVRLLRSQGPVPPLVGQAHDTIDRQVRQLTRLVEDLLDLTRIKQGKVNLRKQPAELAAVVAQAVETSQPLMESRRQELTVTLADPPGAPGGVWLEADLPRLVQVVVNLLNNAARYTPEGGHVWLTAGQEGGEAVVRVRDDGLGINPELLPSLFDLFMQGKPSLKESQGGLGVGLALVKRLVALHGGQVQAHSEGLDKGSEFIVRLPALPLPPPGTPGGTQPPLASRQEKPPPTPARRVLVVDDHVDAAESLATLLRLKGHEVRTAHQASEVLQAAAAFRPEVVLLDIGLPGEVSGHDLAPQLRGLPGLSEALLVALTGFGQEEDRRQSQRAGFDAHLTKPADLAALHALLAAGRTPR